MLTTPTTLESIEGGGTELDSTQLGNPIAEGIDTFQEFSNSTDYIIIQITWNQSSSYSLYDYTQQDSYDGLAVQDSYKVLNRHML